MKTLYIVDLDYGDGKKCGAVGLGGDTMTLPQPVKAIALSIIEVVATRANMEKEFNPKSK